MKSFTILCLVIFKITFLFAQDKVVSGIIFLDKNKDGIYNKNEKLLKGVAVSNQKDIVLTNDKGFYTIPLRDAAFLSVIKPSGYQVTLNDQKFQQNYFFYHSKGAPNYLNYPGVSPTGKVPEQINFPLYKINEDKPLKVLVVGDPQTADNERLDFFRDGGVTDMLRQKADFYIVLGDIADNYLDIYPREKNIISMLNIPGYHVPGNHDINFKSKEPQNHFETFRKEYGPDYYAFNYNKTHFIVLNNVNYFGWDEKNNKQGDYFGGLDKTQFEWLKNDLLFVPEDYLVVLNTHIPFLEIFTDPKILEELNKLLGHRKVLKLSGHTHAIQTYWDILGKSEGVIAGSSCGSWWTGPNNEDGIPVATSMDGSPKGYFVFQFSGTEYQYRFIPSNHPEDYQIRITLPSKTGSQYITANWFVGKKHEKVTVTFDNQTPITMENYTGFDPFIERTISKRVNKDNWTPGLYKAQHLWKAPMSKTIGPGIHKIEITAYPDNGNVVKGYKLFETQ